MEFLINSVFKQVFSFLCVNVWDGVVVVFNLLLQVVDVMFIGLCYVGCYYDFDSGVEIRFDDGSMLNLFVWGWCVFV